MTEADLMINVRASWRNRVAELGLKGKAKERDAFAFLQGVLVTATTCGVMTNERAGIVAMLCMVRPNSLMTFLEEGKL